MRRRSMHGGGRALLELVFVGNEDAVGVLAVRCGDGQCTGEDARCPRRGSSVLAACVCCMRARCDHCACEHGEASDEDEAPLPADIAARGVRRHTAQLLRWLGGLLETPGFANPPRDGGAFFGKVATTLICLFAPTPEALQ